MTANIENILLEMREYLRDLDEDKVRRAYEMAEKSHSGQMRRSGEPYIIHPLAVSEILLNMHMDEPTIIAALLHDVVEDTSVSLETIKKEFGEEVAYLVEGLTKLKKIKFLNRENFQVENLRRMFMSMSKDIRVILIKLADRLHNMRTLKYMPQEKQVLISEETLEIYSPIAHRLGVFKVKWELEDLALKYLDPEGYKKLNDLIDMKRGEREEYVHEVIGKIEANLKELEIEGVVTGRPKHFYSIYNKMKKKNESFDEIYDLIAVRIIVNTIKDCYSSLGAIHTLFTPIPNRFKDYIAMPKPNRYQSVHTTVIGPNGEPFEVQIRTKEMHQISEFGVAAHWKYKEGEAFSFKEFQKDDYFIKQIREFQTETDDATDFIDSLKTDLFSDRLYVFTPKGDVIELRSGSKPLDFAYRVHSGVGDSFVGAKINGHIVTMDYKLQNGDIVEILTSKKATPSLDWLKIVQTKNAQNKIRNWFKNQNRETKVKEGGVMFEKEFKREHLNSEYFCDANLEKLYKSYGMSSLEDLYAGISDGGYSLKQVIRRFKELVINNLEKDSEEKVELKPWDGYGKGTHGIKVKGFDNVDIRISRCCNPLPDDDVLGYINRGKGISIHRVDCPNFIYLKNKEPYRIVELIWEKKEMKNLVGYFEIVATDKKGITPEIISLMHQVKIDVIEINSKVSNGLVKMKIKVGIEDTKHMESMFHVLNTNPNILNARRLIPNHKKPRKVTEEK